MYLLGLFEFAFKVCSRAIWYSGYIVSWVALYSRGVITCLVCLNPQNPRRGTLIYVLGIIILIDGILVIEGIGRYCILVSVSMILFYFCVGECGRYPVFIPGTLWVFIRLGIPVWRHILKGLWLNSFCRWISLLGRLLHLGLEARSLRWVELVIS